MDKVPHILLVEDSLNDGELIAHQLIQAGIDCSLRQIDSAEELAAELAARPPDVVLCDHGGARFDSLAVLQTVHTALPGLPFVIVSGTADSRIANEARTRGASDFVSKNRLVELAPTVRRALRLAEMRRMVWEVEQHRDSRHSQARKHGAALVCYECRRWADQAGAWSERATESPFDISAPGITHTLCPECVRKYTG